MDRPLIPVFISAEIIIYICYLWLDLTDSMPVMSSVLKFLSICLCYLVVNVGNTTIKRAMALTVVSDFLLVLTTFYTLGLFFFIMVQLEYYKYITKKACFPLDHLAVVALAGFVVTLAINFLVMPINFVTFLSVIYFITLINNIVVCVLNRNSSYEYTLLSLCLILIMCCDIHVGVTNVFSYGMWYNFGLIAMWLFYLPSQVLIALLYSTSIQPQRY